MQLKVVKGGGGAAAQYKFISAEATNTRLMGVLGMHVLAEDAAGSPIHLYVYYDIEELGIDHVDVYKGGDEYQIGYILLDNFGGLGADFVNLSEGECFYLLSHFKAETIAKGQPLVKEVESFGWFFSQENKLNAAEISALWKKLCVPIETDNGLINYYIMRCVGFDKEGASMLAAEGCNADFIAPATHGTFLRNKITKLPDGSYQAESLAEAGGVHYVLLSKLSCFNKKIIMAKLLSITQVSDYEASLMLRRDEFVSVFVPKKDLTEGQVSALSVLTLGATHNEHQNGFMHMCFKKDNKHVENQLFLLSDDIRYMLFESVGGEIIAAAYSLDEIMAAEEMLVGLRIVRGSELTERYKFANPLLLDYADSDFDTLKDFLNYLE